MRRTGSYISKVCIITVRKRKFVKIMFPQVFICPGGSLSRGLCPGDLCPGGSLSRGSLSRGLSVQGVSVQGALCPGGLCPGWSLLCRGVSVREVSVHRVSALSGGRSLSRVGLCTVEGSLRVRHPRTVTFGLYASYWNTFLFQNALKSMGSLAFLTSEAS